MIRHKATMPTGRVVVFRAPTRADLEALEAADQVTKLALGLVQEIGGAPVDRTAGPPRLTIKEIEALSILIERLHYPTNADLDAMVAGTVSEPTGDLVPLPSGRVVRIGEPDVQDVLEALEELRAPMRGQLRLLSRCIREVDGKAVTYADLVSWPLDCRDTIAAWMAMRRRLHPTVAEIDATTVSVETEDLGSPVTTAKP